MFHKVKSINALPDYRLRVNFAEGITKEYNAKPLLNTLAGFEIFLEDESLFASVQVDVGGYGISWNDDLDLSCDELWEHGNSVSSPFDGLIAMSDATELWNLNESTLRKAIAYGKLIAGIDACKYGKQWVLSIDSLKREYGEPRK